MNTAEKQNTQLVTPATEKVNKYWDDFCTVIVMVDGVFVEAVKTTTWTFKKDLQLPANLERNFGSFLAAKGFHKGKTVDFGTQPNGAQYLVTKIK